MLKKFLLLAAVSAFAVFNAFGADAVPVKAQIKKCKFSIGREHPGAKGQMSAVADGVSMKYDFTGGGHYTGVEYYPGANNADYFELTFHPKQVTRYFL